MKNIYLISRFIAVVLFLAFSVNLYPQKKHDILSPYLKHVVSVSENNSGILKKNDKIFINVFINTQSPEELRKNGINVRSVCGKIATAQIEISELELLSTIPGVISVDAASMCTPSLDVSVKDIGADKIHNGTNTKSFTGKNVIIGIADYGIDWTHEDFISKDGKSRILFIWDQTDDSGPSPSAGYGTEYTNAQINLALLSENFDIGGKDYSGHGTHVAGIAAGNGRAAGNSKDDSVYVGVAPEADLIIVKLADNGIVPSTRICDAASYIFEKAKELGKPAVVNISFGTQRGPHDGSSNYEKFMDNLVSQDSGRAIVVAAGNDGQRPIHFTAQLSTGENSPTLDDSAVYEFSVDCISENVEDYVSFDIWSIDYTALQIKVTTPKGEVVGPVKDQGDYKFETGSGTVYLTIGKPSETSSDVEILLTISDSRTQNGFVDDLYPGKWKLTFYGNAGRFHGWLYETSALALLTQGAVYNTLVTEPGNSMFTITAASYVSRTEWPSLFADPWGPGGIAAGEISESSSPGPTRSGGQKPTITGPGEYIVSSLSSFITYNPSDHFIASDSVHVAMKGTSMAAPHVTGVIALFLQKNPGLYITDIKSALIYGARTDVLNGEFWNNKWGFGMLDAYESIQNIESSVKHNKHIPEKFEISEPYPNPFNSTVCFNVRLPVNNRNNFVLLNIYSITGRLVYSKEYGGLSGGLIRLEWKGIDSFGNNMPSGIYIYNISVNKKIKTGKAVMIK